MKKTVITIIRIIVIVAILGLLTVTKGGTALHVKCSADQLAVVETQPDGTFHLSFSYSQITNKGTLKDITPAG